MNRVLFAALLALMASCRSTPTASVRVLAPHIARLTLASDEAFEVVPRAGERLGYDWHESRPGQGMVLLRTKPVQGFFSMVGEQVRFEEAVVRVRETGQAVELHVDASLVHGPPGGPFTRRELESHAWYASFFDAVAAEIESD